MRQLVLFVGMFVMVSCGTRTSEEIDDLLDDGDYVIECEFQGCFGGGTEKLEIKDGKTATYTFLEFNKENAPIEKTKTISWTEEKEKKLRELFEIGTHLQDTTPMCTTTAKYALTSWPNSIEFEDRNCNVTEKFEELVK